MKILVFLLTAYTFIKTVSYGIYEGKENKNKPAAITIIVIALGSCILINTILLIR